MKKKIFILLVLSIVLAFGSSTVALADDTYSQVYADNYGFILDGLYMRYSDFYYLVENKDMVAQFGRDTPLLSDSHIIYLYHESASGFRGIRIILSPQYLDYTTYHRPGETFSHGMFGTSSQPGYVYDLTIRPDGTLECEISSGGYKVSIGGYYPYELEECVYEEIVYSSKDIYYLDTDEIYYKASASASGGETDVVKDFYADENGIYFYGEFAPYSVFYSLVENKEKVAEFDATRPYFSNCHIVYLLMDDPSAYVIRVIYAPYELEYSAYNSDGEFCFGLFGVPDAYNLVFEYQFDKLTGESLADIYTSQYTTSICVYHRDMLDEGVLSELKYTNHDIYYLDSDEIFYSASGSGSGNGSDPDSGGSSGGGDDDSDSGVNGDNDADLDQSQQQFDDLKNGFTDDAYDSNISSAGNQVDSYIELEHNLLEQQNQQMSDYTDTAFNLNTLSPYINAIAMTSMFFTWMWNGFGEMSVVFVIVLAIGVACLILGIRKRG